MFQIDKNLSMYFKLFVLQNTRMYSRMVFEYNQNWFLVPLFFYYLLEFVLYNQQFLIAYRYSMLRLAHGKEIGTHEQLHDESTLFCFAQITHIAFVKMRVNSATWWIRHKQIELFTRPQRDIHSNQSWSLKGNIRPQKMITGEIHKWLLTITFGTLEDLWTNSTYNHLTVYTGQNNMDRKKL